MRLSTKGRYATRIMVRLGVYGKEHPVSKKSIAAAEGITPDYVEQILIRLRAAGLVQSHRGIRGGFTVNGDPAKIKVADVLEASEQTMRLAPCDKDGCSRATACVTRDLWLEAEKALDSVFKKTSIADLVSRAEGKENK